MPFRISKIPLIIGGLRGLSEPLDSQAVRIKEKVTMHRRKQTYLFSGRVRKNSTFLSISIKSYRIIIVLGVKFSV